MIGTDLAANIIALTIMAAILAGLGLWCRWRD